MRRDTGVGCGGVIAAVCRPIRRFSVVFTSRCRLLPSSRLYLPLRDASLSLFSPPRCARRDAFSARKKNKIPLLSSLLLSSLFHFFLIIFPLSLSLSRSDRLARRRRRRGEVEGERVYVCVCKGKRNGGSGGGGGGGAPARTELLPRYAAYQRRTRGALIVQGREI